MKIEVKNRLKNKTCYNCLHCAVLSKEDYFRKMQEISFKDITGMSKDDIKDWMIYEHNIVECFKGNTSILIPKILTCENWKSGE